MDRRTWADDANELHANGRLEVDEDTLRITLGLGPTNPLPPGTAEMPAKDDEAAGVAEYGPLPINYIDLDRQYPALREVVIERIGRVGDVLNWIGGSKTGKTWLAIELALCVATGRKLLDKYEVKHSRVLVIDNELHPSDLVFRYRTVAESMGIPPAEWQPMIDFHPMRGKDCDVNRIRNMVTRRHERGDYGVVILDALYKAIPPAASGNGENDNLHMGRVYATLQEIAEHLGALLVTIHHSTKGTQGDKRTTDVGSGAGAISRSADGHQIVREHAEANCVVLEGVTRSFPPNPALGLRWDFPRFRVDPLLDASQLKRENRGGRPKGEGRAPKVPKQDWTVEMFVSRFVAAEAKPQTLIAAMATVEVVEGMKRISEREANRLLGLAEHRKLIYRHQYPPDNKVYFATAEQSIAQTDPAKPEAPVKPPRKRRRK